MTAPVRRRTAFVSLATEDYGRGALVMSVAGLRRMWVLTVATATERCNTLQASMRTRLPDDVDVVVFSDAELAVVPGGACVCVCVCVWCVCV